MTMYGVPSSLIDLDVHHLRHVLAAQGGRRARLPQEPPGRLRVVEHAGVA